MWAEGPAYLAIPFPCPTRPQEPWRRRHVWSLTQQLGDSLGVAATSPIVPLVIGPEEATVAASMQLLARGLHVPAIRPPTVPQGTSRWVASWLGSLGARRGWQEGGA